VRWDADKKIYPRVETASFGTSQASKEESFKLSIKEGASIWRIVTRLYLEDECVMIDHIALDKKRFKNLTRNDFDKREGSIYQLYQMRYGQSVVKTHERLRAGLAGKQMSTWLKLKPESPVLHIRRVALDIQDEPIEWRISTLNTSHHEYFNELVT